MAKIAEVEAARAIMTEAIDWSVMKWMSEKKRVRKLADTANARLDALEAELRCYWPAELRGAYQRLSSGDAKGPTGIVRLATEIRDAHDTALALREEAEAIFDKAEKRMSTSLARDGCKKAIEGWEQHMKAIALFEKGAGKAASQ